ncbi:unnamed protein product, partial [Adineta ricciae]
MASTEEKKVPIEKVAQVTSDTLTQHAKEIHDLQESIKSLQSQLPEDIQTCQDVFNKGLLSTETKLKADIHELREMVADIQQHFTSPNPESLPTTKVNHHTPTVPTRQSTDLNTPSTHYISPATLGTQTIVVPPISSFPTFSGKSTDRPRQFLLRVIEYTRTIHKWSINTLLQGISQFLKDAALEWYCQLYNTNSLPETWDEFVTQFLAQFHSPLRIAQQEHEWDECKQQENETINEFVVRLRSLWLEQKPDETEIDFIKHLFCKMRPDMLTLMNANRSQTLSNIITEAQQVEEIL